MSQSQFLTNWGSQARKGSLELVIMSVLATQEFYGYELVEHLKTVCGLTVNDGTLYAILVRLKSEGFIEHRWEHTETGPARKYYSLTASGCEILPSMHGVWSEIARAVKRAGGTK